MPVRDGASGGACGLGLGAWPWAETAQAAGRLAGGTPRKKINIAPLQSAHDIHPGRHPLPL